MPIPTPERGISKAKYKAAQKAVDRIKARIEKAEKQIAALTVTIPDPILYDSQKKNAAQANQRAKEIKAAEEKQKRNAGRIGRLQTEVTTLKNQLGKQQETVDEYEAQDGK